MISRTCVNHEGAPGIAICTVCEGDICAQCHRSTVSGYCVCATCERKFEAQFQTRWEAASHVTELPGAFLHTVVSILASPGGFFARTSPVGSWTRPAALGLVCLAIGTIVAAVWQYFFTPQFHELIARLSTQVGVPPETALPLFFISLPFTVPITFFIHVALLHLALKLGGAQTSWNLTTRIVGFASAAYILQIVPPIGEVPLGQILALVWLFNLEMAAVRRYFRLGYWRALGIVLIPFLFTMLFAAGG